MEAATSFFFYDLETSGLDPRQARIMQFAGQRTDMDLQPIGESVDILVKLTPDILPDPDAVLVTGITPQQTLQDGVTEAEFLRIFQDQICQDNTIFMGFNTIRFDDEFMRYTQYRNFYDAYEWQWCNNCSRWDLLDVIRMTRALRPEGITWPFTSDGKPTNRLELLTKLNGLSHEHAHDALNDVHATIAVAKLVRDKQPDLFQYLFDIRSKRAVKDFVLKGVPFTYTSGRYPSSSLHTTAAVLLTLHPGQDCAFVYDLRHDPTDFLAMSAAELADAWRYNRDPNARRLPVKALKYNRCPAVAPLGVMNQPEVMQRLGLTMESITRNWHVLKAHQSEFAAKVLEAQSLLDDERAKSGPVPVDAQLYDGFFSAQAKDQMRLVRAAAPDELSDIPVDGDERLQQLLPLYKARNYPQLLTSEERQKWDVYCHEQLTAGGSNSSLARYGERLQQLAASPNIDQDKRYILEELRLYAESIVQFDPGA